MGLSKQDIRRAFDALSAELRHAGERGDVVVIGGAALVLLFGARETTKDRQSLRSRPRVDAYFLAPSASKMREVIARSAEQLELPDDWMNDAAKGFFVSVTSGEVLYESEFLKVRAASTIQLLAMKLAAWRDSIDRGDARLLLSTVSGSMEDVWQSLKPFVPAPQLDKASYAFQDLWEAVHGSP